MQIRWTLAAAADLERIHNYLNTCRPKYMQPTMRKPYEDIRSVKQ
jgi:hypothetical protein